MLYDDDELTYEDAPGGSEAAARGAVKRFEKVLERELMTGVPQAYELWVRWTKGDREVPSVHVRVQGPATPGLIESITRAVEEARSRTATPRLAGLGVHPTSAPSPGTLAEKPALVWSRSVIPLSPRGPRPG